MKLTLMTYRQEWLPLGVFGFLASCASGAPTPGTAPVVSSRAPDSPALAQEEHLADLRQLTHGGENAEAYWSFDGRELILQARPATANCDRIFRMNVGDDAPLPIPVSSGKG